GRLVGSFEYATDLFDASTVERMAGHFRKLLESAAASPDARIGELEMLSDAERQLLAEWHAGRATQPRDSALHELFEQCARATGSAVAVVSGDAFITYDELNRRANRLARRLRAVGVCQEALVALCIERSIEMVVATLGILKAGAAYLPLDPAYPGDR